MPLTNRDSPRETQAQSETPPTTEIVIKPSTSWFSIDWQGMWEYRDMLRFLIVRDFISKYKQTILGPLWFIIQPLFMTVIFTVIFGRVAGISTDGLPPFLFYLCGQLGWTYFQASFTATAGNLVVNAALFRKVYFPRIIVPLSTVFSNLIAFSIQFVTFSVFWLYFKFGTNLGDSFSLQGSVALFPLLLLQTMAIALGAGLWMSALSAKYRDLHHMTGFIAQALLYLTPIIYPMSQVPARYHTLVNLNPLASVVESYRHIFLGSPAVATSSLFQSALITLFILFSGLVFYNRIQRNFVDYS